MPHAHNGIRKFMWPLLRADFELIETYEPPNLEPLDCDVTAIGARADGRYSPEQVALHAMPPIIPSPVQFFPQ